jgi:hypothetical protein
VPNGFLLNRSDAEAKLHHYPDECVRRYAGKIWIKSNVKGVGQSLP